METSFTMATFASPLSMATDHAMYTLAHFCISKKPIESIHFLIRVIVVGPCLMFMTTESLNKSASFPLAQFRAVRPSYQQG